MPIKIPTTNFYVSIRLDKARCRMSGYWKFNSSLLAEADFRNQLELMIKRELTGAIMGNNPLVRREICFLHPSEGGLGVPNVEARRHTLRLTFLERRR